MGDNTMLNRVRVDGFKSIRHLDLDLGSLNVLIGANGSGKSNFVEVFELLQNLTQQHLQQYIGIAGGATRLLYLGAKLTKEIALGFEFGPNSYSCRLSPTAEDRVIFLDETCTFQGDGYPTAYHSFSTGQTESTLPEEDVLQKFPVARLWHRMNDWVVYHFHDTSRLAPVKTTNSIHDTAALRSDAGNLAAYLYFLHDHALDSYKNIRDAIRMVAPFFDDFVLHPVPENADTIRLEWRQKGTDMYMDASSLSDGTLRFMCLATLLLQPQLPSTILLDEPELGLHPYAIDILGSLLRSASTRAQVIVATQSVTLVDQFEVGDIIVADRKNQESTFTRPDAAALASWLKDYSLGELWEKNVLGGRP